MFVSFVPGRGLARVMGRFNGADAHQAKPTLDVVIVSYKNRQTIGGLIRSLGMLKGWERVSVLLHDNSDDLELIQLVSRLCEESGFPATVEACPENCGFARACNRMAKQGRGDWILFINPDAEVIQYPDHWLPEPGIWGPEVVDGRGRKAYLYGIDRGLKAELRRIVLRRDRPPTGYGYVSGACLLVDRDSFSALGGFDEQFYMFYEDIDLGLRASRLAIPVRVNPSWIVRHVGGHSSADGKDRVLRISARSSMAFHAKHGHNSRGWAAAMGTYFGARTVFARFSDPGGSRAFRAASHEYWRLLRVEPTIEVAWEDGPDNRVVGR